MALCRKIFKIIFYLNLKHKFKNLLYYIFMYCICSLLHSYGSVCLAHLGGSCLHSGGSWRLGVPSLIVYTHCQLCVLQSALIQHETKVVNQTCHFYWRVTWSFCNGRRLKSLFYFYFLFTLPFLYFSQIIFSLHCKYFKTLR